MQNAHLRMRDQRSHSPATKKYFMIYPCCINDSQRYDPRTREGVSGAVRGSVDYIGDRGLLLAEAADFANTHTESIGHFEKRAVSE